MQLNGLRPLYQSMRQQNIERTKFRYKLNHLAFDCLFFTDAEPYYELVMGCLGHNFAIFIDVRPGFEITPFIEPAETFYALCEALYQGKGSVNRFDPVTFFAEFNQHIPRYAIPDQSPTPEDLVRWYPDIEESNKRFFCGWLDNSKQGHQVQIGNLAKTRRLLGRRAHDFSQRRNQSTKWTHEQSKAISFFLPEE